MGSLQSVNDSSAGVGTNANRSRRLAGDPPGKATECAMLQDWVARSARLRPESRAVVGEDGSMTYAEMDGFSNRLARTLREQGCRRGDRVAVVMPKSARAVASFIGVLKAGCVYVPLDPAGRMVRTAEIVRRAEPRVVLTGGCEKSIVESLESRRALGSAKVGWLDSADSPEFTAFTIDDVQSASIDPLVIDCHPDDLAYMLFTSGAREPMHGVPTTHRNLGVLINWALGYFELGPDDRVAGHSCLTLAPSGFDLHATFAAGAELHQIPAAAASDPEMLLDFIESRDVSVWLTAPSHLMRTARLDLLEGRSLPSLRHVAWCGDQLPASALRYWRGHAPRPVLSNLYGSTETTIATTYYRVPDDFEASRTHVPIGTACPGQELVVLDADLKEVPEGEIGDIYVRGAGVSPGYWREPEATRNAFLSPSSGADGADRLFRTGDRGRREKDGTVRLLGRPDFQLGIPGATIEPDELEHAILDLADVTACAVVPVTLSDVDGSLVGCAYVPSEGRNLNTRELRRQLAERLPERIIPSRWLILDELPIDHRGKLDRAHIRTLLRGWPAPSEMSEPPRTALWR